MQKIALIAFDSGLVVVANGESRAGQRKRFNLCGCIKNHEGRVIDMQPISDRATLVIVERKTPGSP